MAMTFAVIESARMHEITQLITAGSEQLSILRITGKDLCRDLIGMPAWINLLNDNS